MFAKLSEDGKDRRRPASDIEDIYPNVDDKQSELQTLYLKVFKELMEAKNLKQFVMSDNFQLLAVKALLAEKKVTQAWAHHFSCGRPVVAY
jgi:hypothetical protein